jgi:hypothetical protein
MHGTTQPLQNSSALVLGVSLGVLGPFAAGAACPLKSLQSISNPARGAI